MEAKYTLKRDLLSITFLFLLACGYFLGILSYGNQRVLSSIEGDTWSQFFYWRQFAFSSLLRGELPLWNPYNFSGQPFIGAMQSAVFYPLNLIFLIFDTPLAINSSIAIHCLGASVFTYLFARYVGVSPFGAVLSGITFAYGAPYFLHVYPGHLPHLAAMWMPLMFLAMEAFLRHGRLHHALLAGVTLAIQTLAGYPQYSFYCGLAVSLYFILHVVLKKERRSLIHYIVGYASFIGVAVLLAAVQLVPALEMVKNSARGAVSFEWVSIFSLPPENLLTLFLPNLFGDIINVPYWGKNNLWEMSIYLGVVPLTMMIVGVVLDRNRQTLVLTIIAGVFLLLALGKHTPFLGILYLFVPGFSLFRGVGKAAFVFAFAGAIIAGFGWEKMRAMIDAADKKLFRLGLIFFAFAVLFAAIAVLSSASDIRTWTSLLQTYVTTEEHFETLPLDAAFFSASQRMFWLDVAKLMILALALGLLCLLGYKLKKRAAHVVVVSILVLAVADLWHFGSRYLVSFDPRILSMDEETKAFLKRDTEPFRIATPLARLRNHLLNAGMIEGIENVGGYDAIVLKNYSELINFTQGLPIDGPNLLMGINRVSPLLNLLNVKYYLLDPSIDLNLAGFELAFQNSRDKIYRSVNVLPRSFIVHESRVVNGLENTFRELADSGFQPNSTALVEEPIEGLSRQSQSRSPVPKIVDNSPRRIIIDAEAIAPGLLVLADSYYPGWKAVLDGKETVIYRANHVMRAVPLKTGRHRVEFRYEPTSLKIGVMMTVATAVGLLAFFIYARFLSHPKILATPAGANDDRLISRRRKR